MKMLRTVKVCERVGCSRQTLWRMIKAGEFPPRRVVAGRAGVSGWFEHEVDAWLEANAVPVESNRVEGGE